MFRERVVYVRDRLYEQVWSSPVSKVAAEYGVSGVALANLCRRMRIPLPGRGYWARKAAGQKVKRVPLPPLRPGESNERAVRRTRKDVPAPLTEEGRAVLAHESLPEARILVADDLQTPHRLVAATAKVLRNAKPEGGVVSTGGTKALDVEVAPESVNRALRLLDALVRALDERGHAVVIAPEPHEPNPWSRSDAATRPHTTGVTIDRERVRFRLSEKTELAEPRPKHPPPGASAREYLERLRYREVRVATGRMVLSITNAEGLDVRKTWADGTHQRLEDCLNEFVGGLVLASAAIRRRGEESERRKREFEEQRRQAEEAERRRREDVARGERLTREVEAWRLARDVRAMTAEARRIVAEAGRSIRPDGNLEEWLRWAERYAARIDPLAGLRAELEEVAQAEREAHAAGRGRDGLPPVESTPSSES